MQAQSWRAAFLLGLLLATAAAGAARAAEAVADISADRVEYDPNTKMAVATGHVVIVKDDVRLMADQARYSQASQDLFADGNVRFTRGGQEWMCESLYYNFRTRALSTDLARAKQDEWYVQSGRLRDQGTNRYESVAGYVTTCEYPDPHWRITYKRLVIHPGDRIVGYHAVLRAGPVPLFYWPYFQRSLEDDHMPLNAVPGLSSRFGPFLYLAYEWGLTEEITLTPRLDLRTQHGIGLGLDVDYDFGPVAEGLLRGYYVSDEDPRSREDTRYNVKNARSIPKPLRPPPVIQERFDTERYRLQGRHKSDLTDSLQLMAVAEKLSDPDVVEDYFQRDHRKQIQPDTFVSLTQAGEHYTADLLLRPNLNEFFTKTERLPEASLSLLRTPLGRSGLFYETENSLGYLNREYANIYKAGLPPPRDYDTVRADTFHQLSYPKLLFGWLAVVPRLGGRATYYNRTAEPARNETVRGLITAGSEASFKLSRTFDCNHDALGIHGLRHVITPSVNYSYVGVNESERPSTLFQFDTLNAFDPVQQAVPPVQPKSPRRTETTRFNPVDFPAFNAVDAMDYRNLFRVGLRNQLQTRRDGRPFDLADLVSFVDLHVDSNKDEDTEMFHRLELRPTRWLALDAESRYSFDRADLLDLNTEARILQQDRWSFGVGSRYLKGDSHQVVADFHYALNENWAVRIVERVNLARGRLDEQEYTLLRDLHCWTASLTLRYLSQSASQDEFQVWAVLSLKAFPGMRTAIGK